MTIKELKEKLKKELDFLPPDIVADWEGTNHYEISTNEDPFWLVARDVFNFKTQDWSATEEGRKLGILLDFACKVRRLLNDN